MNEPVRRRGTEITPTATAVTKAIVAIRQARTHYEEKLDDYRVDFNGRVSTLDGISGLGPFLDEKCERVDRIAAKLSCNDVLESIYGNLSKTPDDGRQSKLSVSGWLQSQLASRTSCDERELKQQLQEAVEDLELCWSIAKRATGVKLPRSPPRHGRLPPVASFTPFRREAVKGFARRTAAALRGLPSKPWLPWNTRARPLVLAREREAPARQWASPYIDNTCEARIRRLPELRRLHLHTDKPPTAAARTQWNAVEAYSALQEQDDWSLTGADNSVVANPWDKLGARNDLIFSLKQAIELKKSYDTTVAAADKEYAEQTADSRAVLTAFEKHIRRLVGTADAMKAELRQAQRLAPDIPLEVQSSFEALQARLEAALRLTLSNLDRVWAAVDAECDTDVLDAGLVALVRGVNPPVTRHVSRATLLRGSVGVIAVIVFTILRARR